MPKTQGIPACRRGCNASVKASPAAKVGGGRR